jgi:hypothetical protein
VDVADVPVMIIVGHVEGWRAAIVKPTSTKTKTLQIQRSPGADGLVVLSCTSHPGLTVWVRFPNERNQGKQGHPVWKNGFLTGPTRTAL